MDSVNELVGAPQQFVRESLQLLQRCTKPNQEEFTQISRAVAVGLIVMGCIGYFVKLVHIPINNIIVGGA